MLRLLPRSPIRSVPHSCIDQVPRFCSPYLSRTCIASRYLSTSMASNMPNDLKITSSLKLSGNYAMPVLGYGVYQTPADTCESVVSHALKTGYRHIDSAQAYRNEEPCAAAMRASGIPREDVYFTTKISTRAMGYEKARDSITKSLADTGMDYFDLILIHAPYGGKTAREGTWRALVEAQQQGHVRSIGVSNYGVHHLNELKSYIETSGVGGKIDVGQWELHPWLTHPDIVKWARDNDVLIQAWSPLVRSERASEPVLREIADKHNKTWAQVLLRWSVQMGYIPLAKSVTISRIEENTGFFDFKLDEDDMQKLHFPDSYAPCSWDPTVSND